jgi:geranylgeranyl diphosphate synthase type I
LNSEPQLNYSEILNRVINSVNTRLRDVFEELSTEALKISSRARELVDVGADYTLRGGKRLRAILVAAGCWSSCCDLNAINRVLDLGAAIELLQSYLLVHDDIMDKDELRRGGPTAHVVFTKRCLEHGWSECSHYGTSQAITLGDFLEASAVGLIASSHLPANTVKELLQVYSRGLRRVAYGQFLDVLFSQLPLAEISEREVLLVYELKTSSYTVELPLHLGAIACGGEHEILGDLSRYAIPAGIAFQIRDDIIGLYGSPEVTGKPAGSDVKSKKKTLLVIKAYELADEAERKFLSEVYDALTPQQITDSHVNRVREIVKNTGSLEYCERLIDRYASEALQVLESSKNICSGAKELLKYITTKLAYREK